MDHLSRESVSTRLMCRPQRSLREIMRDVVPVCRFSSGSQVPLAFATAQTRLPVEDGDEARIYTIRIDMSNRFDVVRSPGLVVRQRKWAGEASTESRQVQFALKLLW